MRLTFQTPANENYAAIVVRVHNVIKLDNCDNVVAVPVLGYQAITSKDIEVGDLRVLFTAETQLSEEYARLNNLHRHSDRNDDEGAKGYLEDNRRIKALKFRGHRSSALLMPLESLAYTGISPEQLTEGDTFDAIGQHEICRKYVVPTRSGVGGRAQAPKQRRVEEKLFPAHFDTANYWRNIDQLAPNDYVVVTQKIHGTSIRVGQTLVARKLRWFERLAQRLGVQVRDTEYDYVFGSRRVIKDPNDPDQDNFYTSDVWTEEGRKLEGLLPQGYILYGELIGFVEGKTPIQPNYTYNVAEGCRELYVYRVAHINPTGYLVDLSWDQVKEFCTNLGLRHVPELWAGPHYALEALLPDLLDVRLADTSANALPLSDPRTVDEGVCVRRDGLLPLILKIKSPVFLEHETKLLDKEVVDIETEEAA